MDGREPVLHPPKCDPLSLQKDAVVLGTYETDAFVLSLRERDEFAATHSFGYHRIPHIGVLLYVTCSANNVGEVVYHSELDRTYVYAAACEHMLITCTWRRLAVSFGVQPSIYQSNRAIRSTLTPVDLYLIDPCQKWSYLHIKKYLGEENSWKDFAMEIVKVFHLRSFPQENTLSLSLWWQVCMAWSTAWHCPWLSSPSQPLRGEITVPEISSTSTTGHTGTLRNCLKTSSIPWGWVTWQGLSLPLLPPLPATSSLRESSPPFTPTMTSPLSSS